MAEVIDLQGKPVPQVQEESELQKTDKLLQDMQGKYQSLVGIGVSADNEQLQLFYTSLTPADKLYLVTVLMELTKDELLQPDD